MQTAVEKFSKYTSDIDTELQKIIQSLLSLIECKTKTVRKLIQLHTKIRKVKDVTGKFQSNYFKKESKTDFSLSNDSIVDITTFTETASAFCDEDTRRLRSIRKEDKLHVNSTTSKNDEKLQDPIVQANDSKSNFLPSDNKTNQDQNPETQQHLKPSFSSCVIKSVLNALQECHQGDCEVTMDVCSYRNLIEMLKNVLDSYSSEKQSDKPKTSKENSLKIEVGKSSTHPSLKDAHRETPQRLTCSSTECRPISAKKLRG